MDKMIELPIGIRFYYKGKPCEVVELEDEYDYNKCSKCDMSFTECNVMNCAVKSRKDGKSVCFKWVENEGGKTMKLSEIIDVECNNVKIKEVKKMVYRDLEIYAVKRSLDSRGLISGSFFGTNAEWWCGYVEVPEDMHNLFKPEGHLDTTILDELDDPDSYNLAHVHEGYTYLDNGIPHVLDNGQKLFLGWDYNHCCDIGADVTYDDIVDEGKRVIDSMLEKMKEETAMPEYGYDSIIINPFKEGIESLIGKEVYFSDIPHVCLENANLNDFHYLGILEQIRKDGNAPFKVKGILSTAYWSCIIEKKEEPKPRYVPFENGREFLKSYTIVESCLISENFFLSHHGIWLKDCENDDDCFLVTEIWDDGVVWGSNQKTTHWDELLKDFTFLDGSPCGKEVK